jgi:hypothetical protein
MRAAWLAGVLALVGAADVNELTVRAKGLS